MTFKGIHARIERIDAGKHAEAAAFPRRQIQRAHPDDLHDRDDHK